MEINLFFAIFYQTMMMFIIIIIILFVFISILLIFLFPLVRGSSFRGQYFG